jgi:HEPN domain
MKHFTLAGLCMQPDRIDELMKKAKEELDAVDHLVDRSAADWIVGFHCQQVAEKALKAVLISQGETPPRTHDLILLMGESGASGDRRTQMVVGIGESQSVCRSMRYETLNALAVFHAPSARDLTRRTYEWAERELGQAQDEPERRS